MTPEGTVEAIKGLLQTTFFQVIDEGLRRMEEEVIGVVRRFVDGQGMGETLELKALSATIWQATLQLIEAEGETGAIIRGVQAVHGNVTMHAQ